MSEVKPRCPRCGGGISWIETQKKKDRVYYYAVHYTGYDKVGSKVRKKVRKCYLGPEEYEYVSRLHSDLGLKFKGAIDDKRVIHYLDMFTEALVRADLDRITLVEIISKLKQLTQRLDEYVKEIEKEESVRRS